MTLTATFKLVNIRQVAIDFSVKLFIRVIRAIRGQNVVGIMQIKTDFLPTDGTDYTDI